MRKGNVFPFDFHGDKLYIVEHNNEPYVAMKHIVEGMGLDWKSQRRRILTRFNEGGVKMTSPINGTPQEMIFMSVRKLPGWLMTINANKVRPEIRDKVLRYQKECDDALYDYWTKGIAINPLLKLRERLKIFERLHSLADRICRERRPSVKQLLQEELNELASVLDIDPPNITGRQNVAPGIGDAILDGQAMYEFWDLFDMLENDHKPRINHSMDPDLIAIEPFSFREFCESRKLTFPDINQLRSELPDRTRFPFEGFGTITSQITGEPTQCWIFRCRLSEPQTVSHQN